MIFAYSGGNSIEWLVVLLPIYAVCLLSGLAGAYMGDNGGNRVTGFWCGFLFGPLGLLMAATLRPNRLSIDNDIEEDERVRMKIRRAMQNKP